MPGKGKNTQHHSAIPWKDLFFERIKEEEKTVAKCLFCDKNLKNTSLKRLESHRNICQKKCASNISIAIDVTQENSSKLNIPSKKTEKCQNVTPSLSNEPQIQSIKANLKIPTTFDAKTPPTFNAPQGQSTTKAEMSEIDEVLGMFFFGCNIPFSVVESDNFLSFVKKLNPDYVPPSRKTLSGSLLDRIYEKMINTQSAKVDENSVLLLDGWKNKTKNEKYVVGTIHNCKGGRLFLNAWDFTEKSETALTLKEVTEEAVAEAKKMYNTEIYALVSDNVSTMTCMGKMIDLWHVTCNSHSGNLLAKGLVESEFNAKVCLVLVEFKSPNLERQLIKLGGHRIILPGETRWCSYRDSDRCCLRNLEKMRKVVEEGICKVDSKVVDLIFDKSFEEELVSSIIIYDGVCELVNKCQSADFDIAHAVEEWLKLQFPLCDDRLELLLEKHLEKVIRPISLAANILHPVYKGKLFSTNERYAKMAENFFKETLDEIGLKDLAAYQNEEGIFHTLKQKGVEVAETFWTIAEPRHPELSQLAKLLIKIPSSTAAIERLFSQWSFVHSKLRNRLTMEKSKKLIHIYYSLKMTDSNLSDDY